MPAIRGLRHDYVTHSKTPHTFRIKPEMGVVKHFPKWACEALIEKGAAELVKTKKPSTKKQSR